MLVVAQTLHPGNGVVKFEIIYITNYRISRPIRRTLIFSLEILEKMLINVF
jgi:hypothetical protein